MPQIIVTSPLLYLGIIFLIVGGFIILAGQGIVKVQSITVTQSRRTSIVGVAFMILGIILLVPEISRTLLPSTSVTPPDVTTEMPGQKPTAPQSTTQASGSVITSADYGPLLYEENFDQNTGAWSLGEKSLVKDGNLIIGPGDASFTAFPTQYDNFILDIGFQYPRPSPTTNFGVYFRESLCGEKLCGYYVHTASDGSFGAQTYVDPTSRDLLTPSVAYALAPNGPNRLTILAKGNNFEIYLNGSLIGDYLDSTYTKGKFHLDADFGPVAVDYVRVYGVP